MLSASLKLPSALSAIRDNESEEEKIDVIDLEDALRRLGEVAPRQERIVELRFFVVMTSAEVADYLGISKSTTDREWRVVRAWLRKQLTEDDGE